MHVAAKRLAARAILLAAEATAILTPMVVAERAARVQAEPVRERVEPIAVTPETARPMAALGAMTVM